jgi:DNA-3-methyladenine glycosylase II
MRMKEISFSLSPVPPFRLDLTAWALRRRAINEIDAWDGETYSRVLAHRGQPAFVQVRQTGLPASARLHVKITAARPERELRERTSRALEQMLGLRVNLNAFYRLADGDLRLRELARRFRGLKPPRFPSVFEALVNGIACQQLTLHVGLLLLNRLSARCGVGFATDAGARFAFPSPEGLAVLPVRSFRALGFSAGKAAAIRQISREVATGRFLPGQLASLEKPEVLARLMSLRGVGRWTAEYVMLRGLGRTHLFPGDDVGARNNLKRWLSLTTPLDYESVNEALASWNPFAGLLYFHLLLDGLDRKGFITPIPRHAARAA